MIRLSRLADYGVLLACQMAVRTDRCHNAFDLAATTGLPPPTVSKLLAAMARAGVLVSHRGAKGGYRLARPPETRELPSGDRLVAYEVTVERPNERAETVPVVWFAAPASADVASKGASGSGNACGR